MKPKSCWSLRVQLKETPDEVAERNRVKDKDRNRMNRALLKEDQFREGRMKKKSVHEAARLRQKRHRAQKNGEATVETAAKRACPEDMTSEEKLEKKRKYYQEYRKRERAKRSIQKQVSDRKSDKERKQKGKVTMPPSNASSTSFSINPQPSSSTITSTPIQTTSTSTPI